MGCGADTALGEFYRQVDGHCPLALELVGVAAANPPSGTHLRCGRYPFLRIVRGVEPRVDGGGYVESAP